VAASQGGSVPVTRQMSTIRKVWSILTRAQRRSASAVLTLMVIGMVLETLGIGLVIPAFILMTRSDVIARSPMLSALVSRLGNPDREHLVIAGMLTLVAFYVLKTVFLAFLTWRQTGFVSEVQNDLSQRLFCGYLRQPYSFHLQRNSAQLVNILLGEVNLFAHTCLMASLTLLTELMVVVGISALLLVFAPVGAVVIVGIIGVPSWVFHRVLHNRILSWGTARQLHEERRLQESLEGLGGAKDVILLGREKDFLARYARHSLSSAHVIHRLLTFQQLPRLGLELLAMCGLAGLVIVLIAQRKPVDSLLPTLGLFAAAAFRILPSANKVITSIQQIRSSLPAVDVMRRELARMHDSTPKGSGLPLRFLNVLELRSVTFQYDGTERPALCDLSLSVPCGKSVGFIGGSGSGKSTLIDVILGLHSPMSGGVLADGIDIRTNLRDWQDRIGYVPQSIFLTDDTLRRNVAFGIPDDQIDHAAVLRAIGAAQLDEFIAELPEGLETRVGERGVRLSGGQLQRIGIARALYHDPSILVLDEATSALDMATEREVMEAVRALHGRKTVIIVAHRLSTVEHCDLIYRIEFGRVADSGEAQRMVATGASAPR
jgi:ABC-type multidrug transport system fused ATPase/permease subunit